MDKSTLMRQIGANIQKYRMDKQLTQERLANLVDKNPTTITRLEGGQRMLSIVSLVDMAMALDVSCDALIFGECKQATIQNIVRLLENESEETLESIELIIKTCLEEFRKK